MSCEKGPGSSPSSDVQKTTGEKLLKYAPVAALAAFLGTAIPVTATTQGCGVDTRKVWVDGNGATTSIGGQGGSGGEAGNGAGAQGGLGGQAGAGGEAGNGTGGQGGSGGEAGSGGTDACVGSGYDMCEDVCADLSVDLNNCGECGNVCEPAMPFCVEGACGAACRDEYSDCCEEEGNCDQPHPCSNTLIDPANCGACGNACSGGENCTNGHCEQSP